MEIRYKKILEGTISDFLKPKKQNIKRKPSHKSENTFEKAFVTAKKSGVKTFIWKNPNTKIARTYNTDNDEKKKAA